MTSPILKLFDDITADLAKDSNGHGVHDLMKTYCENHSDWTDYEHYNDIKYSRKITETQFVYSDTKKTEGNGPLEQSGVFELHGGDIGYIDDGIALHRLFAEETSVTIHVYAKPMDRCNIYEMDGSSTERALGYFTQGH